MTQCLLCRFYDVTLVRPGDVVWRCGGVLCGGEWARRLLWRACLSLCLFQD